MLGGPPGLLIGVQDPGEEPGQYPDPGQGVEHTALDQVRLKATGQALEARTQPPDRPR